MSGVKNDGTTNGALNPAGAWAFFADELRRGAMAVAGGLLAVAALLAVPRLTASMLPAGGEDLRLAAAMVGLLLVLPLLGLYLATAGWARERADGTLGWLYTRPLSANAIFALRLAAFTLALAVFAALVLLATWTPPSDVFTNPLVGGLSSVYAYSPLLFPFLAAALFVSATAARGRLAPMLAATVGALAGLALLPELPLPRWELLADPAAAELRRGVLLYGVYPLALLAGAWVAVRRAVVDRRMRWRGVWVAAAIAAAGSLLSTALAAHQIWGDPWRQVAVRELAGGGEVRLLSGHGYDPWVLRLDLTTADGVERTLPGTFLAPTLLVSPRGELAVFEGVRTAPRMRWVRPGGGARLVAFDAAVEPLGWSTDGRRLAIQRQHADVADGLLLFDAETAALRPLPLPWLAAADRASFWTAAWIDGRHLLVWSLAEGGWWAVADAADAAGRPVAEGEVAAGARLQPMVTERWMLPSHEDGSYAVAPPPVARRDGRLIGWLRRGERRELVAVDAAGGFEVLAERPVPAGVPRRLPIPDPGLGVVGRTVVWVEGGVVMAAPAGAAPARSCALPGGFDRADFRGAAGRFGVWAPSPFSGGAFRHLFACDPVSGEGELIGDLGPWGVESAQVTADGLRTPSGLRRLGD